MLVEETFYYKVTLVEDKKLLGTFLKFEPNMENVIKRIGAEKSRCFCVVMCSRIASANHCIEEIINAIKFLPLKMSVKFIQINFKLLNYLINKVIRSAILIVIPPILNPL